MQGPRGDLTLPKTQIPAPTQTRTTFADITRQSSLLPVSQGKETFDGKCKAFRKTLFPKPPPGTTLAVTPRELFNWDWNPVSIEELEQACSSKVVKGKTPGLDRITQEIIAKAFQAVPDTFLKVYGALINKGYHPKCWRRATGAILAKPGKPDYSIPKAYRVISLLNCLGKISERILAKRLSMLAETSPLLHNSQLGGRRKKSAVDTVMLLEILRKDFLLGFR